MADKKRLFLFDAYALIFRGYYAFIKNPRINSKGQDTSAIMGFTNSLFDVIRRENPDHLGVCFDKGGSHARTEMYEEYKAHRDETPQVIRESIPVIKDILKAMHIPIVEIEGVEADDIIGTLAKQAEKEDYEVYMVTPDKDFAQLITENVFMYRPSRRGNGTEIWKIPQVQEKFGVERPEQVIDYLGMRGDAADNIPGIPGVGDKTAKKFIAKYGGLEGLLANTDELKGKMKEKVIAFAEQGRLSRRLATIITDCDVKFNENTYELTPPDLERVLEIFKDLEFRRLTKQLINMYNQSIDTSKGLTTTPTAEKKKTTVKPVAGAGQFSLFGNESSTEKMDIEEMQGFITLDKKPHFYQLVAPGLGRKLFIEKLIQQNSVCFDLETTSLNTLDAEIVGIAFSWETGKGYYVPLPENQQEAQSIMEEFRVFFENEKIEKVGQNLKYDIKVLKNYQVEVLGEVFDTM